MTPVKRLHHVQDIVHTSLPRHNHLHASPTDDVIHYRRQLGSVTPLSHLRITRYFNVILSLHDATRHWRIYNGGGVTGLVCLKVCWDVSWFWVNLRLFFHDFLEWNKINITSIILPRDLYVNLWYTKEFHVNLYTLQNSWKEPCI